VLFGILKKFYDDNMNFLIHGVWNKCFVTCRGGVYVLHVSAWESIIIIMDFMKRISESF